MKIIYIDTVSFMGGGQHQLVDVISKIIQFQENQKLNISVLYNKENQILANSLTEFKINHLNKWGTSQSVQFTTKYHTFCAFFRSILLCIDILKLVYYLIISILKLKPQIVYANSRLAALLLSLIKPIFSFKIVYNIMNVRSKNFSSYFDWIIFSKIDGALFNSHFTKNTYAKVLDYFDVDTEIVYSIVKKPNVNFTLNSKFTPDNLKIIGYIGRITPRKKLEHLIQSCSLITNLEYNLVFVGQGDTTYIEHLKLKAIKLGVNLSIHGYSNEIHHHLRNFDVLVLPTDNEAFGRVILEAIYLSTPVIISKPSGASEIMSEFKKVGFTYNYGDIHGLYSKILEALNTKNYDFNYKSDNQTFDTSRLVTLEYQFIEKIKNELT